MNGINIPDAYKKTMRRERMSMEYLEATIRDYVMAREGKVITGADFIDALDGRTTANVIVSKLIKKGKLIRIRVKNGSKGHQFTYKWNQGGTVHPIETRTHGEVITRKRTVFATELELKRLDEWFLHFCSEKSVIENPDQVIGANNFRIHVYKQVRKEEDNATTETKE